MEYLTAEIGINPENRVGGDDNMGQLVSALPTRSIEVVPENRTKDNVEAIGAEAPQPDAIVDLVQGIESLKKDDALARLLELEEDQAKTFFEMGGLLSAIQKHKWFAPCASLDEWIEKNTAIRRAKARALIQIYDAIIKSGVKWADVKHLEWTKLRAIAGLLDGKSAGLWIEMASNHGKAELIRLVQDHLARSTGQKSCGSIAARVKTVKFHDDQIERVQAAIDRAKEIAGVQQESAALDVICNDYVNGGITMTVEMLVTVFAKHLSTLGDEAADELLKAVRAPAASHV